QARIMLIRRYGRRETSPRRAWCVVDDPRTAVGKLLTWGTWHVAEDLEEPAALLTSQASSARERAQSGGSASAEKHDTSAIHQPCPPLVSTGSEPELLLVCTHGKHDVCCASRGRPVAAALTQRWPEATWECSHTGGDRFAANVIALPDGACYGGLDPDVAVNVLEQHFSGGPDPVYLRGWTGHTPAEQAAVIAAHRALPAQRWGSIIATGVSMQAGERRVRLQTQFGSMVVPVTEEIREPHHLTCAALAPNRATVPVAGQVQPLRV
ncbi:MAG: sucrase ferredoxin, partial [Ornithinimicrobium sp.]